MKKRIMQSLLLVAIVCLSALCSSPVMGDSNDIITGVAVQEQTTSLRAGISEIIQTMLNEPIEHKYYDGWTTTSVNIRSEPSLDSEILEIASFNTKIHYRNFNEEWVLIPYDVGVAYINKQYISNEELNYKEYTVPITSGFKSYMPYTAITSRESKQYKLQQMAYTGNYGIRMVDGRYCVALGTAFNADVGTYFDLILANETVISCVVGDVKADKHTDKNNMITVANGCLTEFITDSKVLDKNAKRMGDISYCCDEWNSRVEKIRVYDKNVFEKGE